MSNGEDERGQRVCVCVEDYVVVFVKGGTEASDTRRFIVFFCGWRFLWFWCNNECMSSELFFLVVPSRC